MAKTILIVEDDFDLRTFLKVLLESFGYQSDRVANGHEALDELEAGHFDLVLMDLKMPIMMTASRGFDIQEIMNAGFDELIVKPFETDKLKSLLKRFLFRD